MTRGTPRVRNAQSRQATAASVAFPVRLRKMRARKPMYAQWLTANAHPKLPVVSKAYACSAARKLSSA
jgi:hypothetical protein